MDDVLVGRGRELGSLVHAVGALSEGHGGVRSISGEPGVGKTTLARQLARVAGDAGLRVLWGTCFEGDAQTSYGAWITATAPLGVTLHAGGTGLPAAEARLRLFTEVLGALAAGQPTMLVIDDLHWASDDSVELFRHVAVRAEAAGVLLVGTYRDPDLALAERSPLTGLLAALLRLPGYAEVRLRGLDHQGVGQLLTHALGDEAPGAIVETVHEQTGGNPFYVRQVVDALVEEGRLVRRGDRWLTDFSLDELGIPRTVRQAVKGRVTGLSPATRDLLQAAALFTGDLDLDTVKEVAALGEVDALDALDEALATGLLVRTGRADAPYAFAHAIVRHALADLPSPDRSARLHRRATEVLERLRPREHAAIAEQFWLSRSLPGSARGVPHGIAAAEAAIGEHAHRRAARLLEQALDLAPEDDRALRAGLLARLAAAQADALDYTAAAATAAEAIAMLDPPDAARLAIRVCESLRDSAPPSSWEPLVRRGLERVGDRGDALWARLAVAIDPVETVASGPLHAGRWRGYPAAAVAALLATGREDDEARALEPFRPRTEDETRALVDRAEGWTSAPARRRVLDIAGRDYSLRQSRPHAAIDCYRRLNELGRRIGSVPAQVEACAQLALCYGLVGELPRSEEYLARSRDLVGDLWPGHRLSMLGTVSSAVILGYVAGEADWDQLAARLTRFVRDPAAVRAPWANVFAALGALCHAFAGGTGEAARLVREVCEVVTRMRPSDHAVAGSIWFATAAAFELRDPRLVPPLRPLIDRHRREQGPPGPMGSLDHADGRLWVLAGQPARAAACYARAREAMDAAGCLGVRAILDLEEAMLSGTPERIEACAAACERLGMRGWAARATTPAAPAGMTPREIEVLRLLASGMTSKEIAAELVVSAATVNRHVANLYRKIGRRNRSEATAFAIAHGLVPPA